MKWAIGLDTGEHGGLLRASHATPGGSAATAGLRQWRATRGARAQFVGHFFCAHAMFKSLPTHLLPTFARHPSVTLLVTQIAVILVLPLLGNDSVAQLLFSLIGLLVLGMALRVVRRSQAANGMAMGLSACVLVLAVWQMLRPSLGVQVAMSVLEAAFYFYASWALIGYMLQDHVATRDELYAAAATFTVLAWAWAHVFMVYQLLAPGSFSLSSASGRAHTWFDMLFLSFTCLSGVGLGDTVPLAPMAKSLVMLAEFAGVMYVALVVSRLVGMAVSRRVPPSANERDRP